MQTNPCVEQNQNSNSFRVHGISPVDEEKVDGGKLLPKSGLCVSLCGVYACVIVCSENVK